MTSGDQRPVGVGPDGDELVARYEDLRGQMLRGGVSAGLGLAVLMRGGVAAWIRAWSSVCPPPASAQADAVAPVPGALLGEVVLVLAGMALGSTSTEVHP